MLLALTLCLGVSAKKKPKHKTVQPVADYALLIDTMMGWGNLKTYCETLTSKPIKLVNTHAHPDHTGGNFHFDACYLHPRDIPYFQVSLGYGKEVPYEQARQAALPEYRELASLLGGKLGCTRPVFDRGVLPFKLVIGQSGVVVKPKLYLSFGVSGAVNHVTGMNDSGCIVAVNKDPDAAIFKYCDYGIVGDMDEVCDQMLRQLKGK